MRRFFTHFTARSVFYPLIPCFTLSSVFYPLIRVLPSHPCFTLSSVRATVRPLFTLSSVPRFTLTLPKRSLLYFAVYTYINYPLQFKVCIIQFHIKCAQSIESSLILDFLEYSCRIKYFLICFGGKMNFN